VKLVFPSLFPTLYANQSTKGGDELMGEKIPAREKRISTARTVTLHATFSHFALPPVRDALIVGRKAAIGPHALHESLEVLMPEQFELIHVDHPTIEAVLVRRSDLRKFPKEKFVPLLLEMAEGIMDETDCLRVDISVEVSMVREVSL